MIQSRKKINKKIAKATSSLTLNEQMRLAALEIHPLVAMLAGQMHGINAFISLFETANPDIKTKNVVNHFVGDTLMQLGRNYLSRIEQVPGEAEAGQEKAVAIVSSDGSPLGGTD